MKSTITMSVIALAAAFVVAGCTPKEEGTTIAGSSSTNANIAGVVTNAPSGTNLLAGTNMSTNLPMTTNMSGMTNMSTNMPGGIGH